MQLRMCRTQTLRTKRGSERGIQPTQGSKRNVAMASCWRLMWSQGKARRRRSARPPARANNTANRSAKRPFTTSWLSPSTTATSPVSLCRNARVSAAQPPWASHTSGRYWTPAARQSASVRLCCRLRRAYWEHAVPPACRVSSQWLSPKAFATAMSNAIGEALCDLLPAPTRRQPSTSIQDSSCFELWAELGPLAVVKDQVSNAIA